ncbi:hypothetical protein HQ533_00290 [Candidatus Woesearchaeota archaeon]|nr:hypothetical protein [Candidatus Woesearchaeota archaeon]
MIKPIFLSEGLRMFRRKLRVGKKGFRRYSGNADEICKQIVDDCYNKERKYFMTSTGHYSQYWSRDFGLCVKALKELGYEKEIINTLNYALNLFEKNKGITTTITPDGKPFDFPKYAPDSLAYSLHSLIVCRNKELVEKYKPFLESEARKFFNIVVDKNTGLVKKKHFSSIKDQSIRKSSCYDNVMVAWVSENLNKLELQNPMKNYNFKKIIKDNFWKGEYFIEDLSGRNIISGDANVFPFWTGIFDSKEMMKSAIKALTNRKLDKPLPLKYCLEKPKLTWYLYFSTYELDNVWVHLGYPYIDIVPKVDKKLARDYLEKYSKTIEKNRTFLELYDNSGKIYKTPLYISDEGMLWASMHIYLSEKLKN